MSEIKIGVYKHYKGNEYFVLGEALHTETEEEMIIYRLAAITESDNRVWARPKKMFLETVEIDGEVIPRFKIIAEVEELTADDMLNVLSDVENNLVTQYKHLFNYSDVKLSFDKEALNHCRRLNKAGSCGICHRNKDCSFGK